MSYRVIQWATGRVGTNAIRGIVSHPGLELAGVWVHSKEKEGTDAGDLAGIERTGITATSDADALLESDADCVCYTATSMGREEAVVEDLTRILRSGKNVVSTSSVPLVYPPSAGDGIHEKLEKACIAGGSSIFTWGIDPGYAAVGTAISALSMCEQVRSVRMTEIINYSTWDFPGGLALFGFGQPDESKAPLLRPGATTAIWGTSIHMVANQMGAAIEEIVETHEVLRAEADFDVPAGHIEAGTISAMKFAMLGMVGGRASVVIDHVTRLRDEDAPVWDQGHGYRIQIEGEPTVRIDLDLSSPNGDIVHAAYVATAMPVVNAVPRVCDAAPGVLTFGDLPPTPCRNLLRGP